MIPDAPFESGELLDKGLGAFAIRDIPPGKCFHVEEPLLIYHGSGIPTEQELELLYIRLKLGKKELFRSLCIRNDENFPYQTCGVQF